MDRFEELREKILPVLRPYGVRQIARDYFEVNLRTVWDTYKYDLPPLKEEVERILAEAT
jgi:uncharacterized protein with HEPN domain